jgi:hypothetical protein
MDELERKLSDLAAHRASQVPEFDMSSLASGVDSRRPPLSVVLAIAALIVAFLVIGGYALFGANGSGDVHVVAPASSSVGPGPTSVPTTVAPSTTAPPTTTPAATCPATNNDTAAQSGSGTVTSVPPLAQLEKVEVWSSQCVDEVTFKFSSTVPGWTISYQTGPLTLEPSAQPVTVAGSAYLVVQFANASGSGSDATDLVPQPPVGVREVRKVQDFEGVVTWVIGLDSERPFGVSTDTQAEITIDLPVVPGPGPAR